MKKLLLLLVAAVSLGTAANAQFTHRFDIDMVRPTGLNSTNPGSGGVIDTVLFRVIVSQGSINAGTDTLGITTSSGRTRLVVTNNSYAQGDTLGIRITNDTISIPAQTGTYAYCGRIFMFDRANSTTGFVATTFDTTGYNSCVPLNVNFAAGVEDFKIFDNSKKVSVKVYPNPATGNTINLDYVAQNTTEAVVNIYDLTGRKVLTHSYGKAFKGQENYSVDISGINKGMYILEIRQDGIKATGQFIK